MSARRRGGRRQKRSGCVRRCTGHDCEGGGTAYRHHYHPDDVYHQKRKSSVGDQEGFSLRALLKEEEVLLFCLLPLPLAALWMLGHEDEDPLAERPNAMGRPPLSLGAPPPPSPYALK